jgi:hypothetical protein
MKAGVRYGRARRVDNPVKDSYVPDAPSKREPSGSRIDLLSLPLFTRFEINCDSNWIEVSATDSHPSKISAKIDSSINLLCSTETSKSCYHVLYYAFENSSQFGSNGSFTLQI